MGLNNLLLLTLLVGFVVFATVQVTGHHGENDQGSHGNDTDCEELNETSTTLLCPKSDAIQNIERKRICLCGGRRRDYELEITCKNNYFCNEVCQWTTDCSTAKYGQKVYAAGIKTVFYNKERYTIVLCCTAQNVIVGPCEQIKVYLSQYVTEGTGVIHQMVVNPEPKGKPFALIEVCDFNNPPPGPLCPDRVITVDSSLDSTLVDLAELGGQTEESTAGSTSPVGVPV